MGFYDVFTAPTIAVGGGVTPGQEPWKGRVSVMPPPRNPKPLILYPALPGEQERALFAKQMAAIMARNCGESAFVRDDDYAVVESAGIVWLADHAQKDFGRISLALDDRGFDPTRCAVQVYINVLVSGAAGMVHFRGRPDLIVRLVHGERGDEKLYEGRHDLGLVVSSPGIFAVNIATAMGLPAA